MGVAAAKTSCYTQIWVRKSWEKEILGVAVAKTSRYTQNVRKLTRSSNGKRNNRRAGNCRWNYLLSHRCVTIGIRLKISKIGKKRKRNKISKLSKKEK